MVGELGAKIRMKTILVICLCALSGLLSATAVAEPPAPVKFVVAFAQDTMANDWRAAQVRELRTALAAYPDIEFRFSDAGGDTAQQVRDIENFAEQRVDVLITSPRDAGLMREPIARVYRSGIPVILLTRRVAGEEFTLFITADNCAIARQAARHLALRLENNGNILILQGLTTTSSAIERTHSFLDELAQYPDLRVVAIKPADFLRSSAIMRVEEAIAEPLLFDAIYAQSDSMALGAILALKKAGLDPRKIPIVGIDYISDARTAIRAGELDASFTFPTAGREGAEAAVTLLRGGRLDSRQIIIESTAVTLDNVDDIEPIF